MFISVVIGGILSSNSIPIPINSTYDNSEAMIHALQYIVNHFYYQHTSNVFIMVQADQTSMNDGLKPLELASELIRIESSQMTCSYVIESNVTARQIIYQRDFNIFFVDNYESFT